ncbi:MAG: hypothetical protein FJ137_22140, partial [Deltaproteobacteria bacterium]|nr:hypothetical protein [Deltaproteobacteria bacterium]
MTPKSLDAQLIDARLVDEAQLQAAVAYQKQYGGHLVQAVLRLQLVSEDRLLRVLGQRLGLAVASPPDDDLHPQVLAEVDVDFAQENGVFPLALRRDERGEVLVVAAADPTNVLVNQALARRSGKRIELQLTTDAAIEAWVARLYLRASPADVPAPVAPADEPIIDLEDFELDIPVVTDPAVATAGSNPLPSGALPGFVLTEMAPAALPPAAPLPLAALPPAAPWPSTPLPAFAATTAPSPLAPTPALAATTAPSPSAPTPALAATMAPSPSAPDRLFDASGAFRGADEHEGRGSGPAQTATPVGVTEDDLPLVELAAVEPVIELTDVIDAGDPAAPAPAALMAPAPLPERSSLAADWTDAAEPSIPRRESDRRNEVAVVPVSREFGLVVPEAAPPAEPLSTYRPAAAAVQPLEAVQPAAPWAAFAQAPSVAPPVVDHPIAAPSIAAAPGSAEASFGACGAGAPRAEAPALDLPPFPPVTAVSAVETLIVKPPVELPPQPTLPSAPVAAAPVVAAPVVAAPVVEAPVVEAPVVAAPVIEELAPLDEAPPLAPAPAVVAAPVVAAPVLEEL